MECSCGFGCWKAYSSFHRWGKWLIKVKVKKGRAWCHLPVHWLNCSKNFSVGPSSLVHQTGANISAGCLLFCFSFFLVMSLYFCLYLCLSFSASNVFSFLNKIVVESIYCLTGSQTFWLENSVEATPPYSCGSHCRSSSNHVKAM